MPVANPRLDAITVNVFGMMKPGIHDHQPLKTIRRHHGLCKANWATPILTNQGHAPEVKLGDQSREDFDMPADGVPVRVGGLIRSAKTHVIGRDATIPRLDETRDHLSIQVGPGRHTVKE